MIWPPGATLQNGKYVIEGVLGQGGFGITYKTRNTTVDGYVALKTPNRHLTDEPQDYAKYLAQFKKEAKRVAKMSNEPHPNLVRFIDFFEEGETPCFVMEFVVGETLSQRVKQSGALPEAEVLRILQEIGGALQWMHDRNLVHRDVNPSNIVMCQTGRAVLIDLGIAQQISPSTRSLTSTRKDGTDSYAPYEQRVKGVRDPRVDVYALAASMYFAITGMKPPTWMERKVEDVPLQAPATRVSLSWELDRAIVQGMALEIEARPQRMRDWIDTTRPAPPPKTPLPKPPRSDTASDRSPSTAQVPKRAWKSAMVGLVFVMGYVALGMPLGMLGNDWAVAWAVAVAWVVAVACAVAVAWVVAWVVAWAGAIAVAFSWSEIGAWVEMGEIVITAIVVNLCFGGLLILLSLKSDRQHNAVVGEVIFSFPIFLGVAAQSCVEHAVATEIVTLAQLIAFSWPLSILGIAQELARHGYSSRRLGVTVALLASLGLGIGWLLGRFALP